MKYKGKVISGSSLLTILGVICFATLVVSAALIATMVSTTGRNVVTTPMTLTTPNIVGSPDYPNWGDTGDALVGTTYDQGLHVVSTWSGTYAITIIISAGRALVATDVTVGYKLPDTNTGTISNSGNVWTVDTTHTGFTYNTLTYVLPTQTYSAAADYAFTIMVNNAASLVVMNFLGNSV